MKKKTYVAPVVKQVDFMVEGGFAITVQLMTREDDNAVNGATWENDNEFDETTYFAR